VATELKNQFVQHQQLYDKTQVLFNGIDEKRFQGDRQKARETFAIGSQEFAIGNVGNLSELKNQRLLLRAMASLKRQKRVSQFKILFAGEVKSEYAELMRQDVRQLGLQDETKFLGPVKDIGSFFAATDLVVHCAQREGFPRVVPEAMLARRAVVATAAAGVRDAIPNERYGSVVPLDDQQALEQDIEQLLNNPNLRETIATQAYERARALFSLEMHRERVLRLYQGLLASRTASSNPS
jgi:glycosyltransferase involved in cell wall biosynthesis